MDRRASQIPHFEMGATKEQLEIFAQNAIHGLGSSDRHGQLQQAAEIATVLGYNNDIFGAQNGVHFASVHLGREIGSRTYLPGFFGYSRDEHVKGLTNTIIDSALYPPQKAELVDFLAGTVSEPAMDPDGYSSSVLAPAAMSRRHARQQAMDELRAIRARTGIIGVEQFAMNLKAIDMMLNKAWHPHRRKAVVLAGSTAVALWSAATIRRHTK